ncbi:hypothetical protein B0T26DRAFT_276762 [Lasiosphaeria miniovina]|uniref:Uncharacterized protein n=1 Tax=Lasiosphaeria miniovina TaxID=1954250 RepID=A0AA40AJI8_9PEZI|nr:uncharacterized protein B0T26DRAFT_276762 [Lasiosphaeria miniovina]KAK0717038.1 hypothetical protein B0T26DRAFT_276762 [Lasiosphaeria miniovina]
MAKVSGKLHHLSRCRLPAIDPLSLASVSVRVWPAVSYARTAPSSSLAWDQISHESLLSGPLHQRRRSLEPLSDNPATTSHYPFQRMTGPPHRSLQWPIAPARPSPPSSMEVQSCQVPTAHTGSHHSSAERARRLAGCLF